MVGLPTLHDGLETQTEWKSESINNQRGTVVGASVSKNDDVNQYWCRIMLTSWPGRRATLSPALSAFSRSKSTFTLLHAVTPSCRGKIVFSVTPTLWHWSQWRLLTGLPCRPEWNRPNNETGRNLTLPGSTEKGFWPLYHAHIQADLHFKTHLETKIQSWWYICTFAETWTYTFALDTII